MWSASIRLVLDSGVPTRSGRIAAAWAIASVARSDGAGALARCAIPTTLTLAWRRSVGASIAIRAAMTGFQANAMCTG
jgi:hypothetical protein